jgi:hypothetical protein
MSFIRERLPSRGSEVGEVESTTMAAEFASCHVAIE